MVYLRNNDSAQVTRIPKNITGTGQYKSRPLFDNDKKVSKI